MKEEPFRQAHLLQVNHGYSSPHSFVFVDTESSEHPHPEIKSKRLHCFRLGVASYARLDHDKPTRQSSIEFTETVKFWEWLDRYLDKRRPVYLFAHNLGFDLVMLGFWQLLDQGVFRLADDLWPLRQMPPAGRPKKRPWRGALVTEDAPTIVCVRKGDATIKCIDTRNYFPQSLQKLATVIGLVKLPLPKFSDGNAKWFERCRVDVQIIRKAMLDLIVFWKGKKYGTWRNTAPGLSWNAYRHSFMDHQIEVSGHRKAVELERAGYYGGECRAFFVGKVSGPVTHLDVHSLYPSVMRKRLYPCKFRGWIEKLPLDKLQYVLNNHACCAEVVLRSENECYPVRIGNRTVHAVGTFATVLAGPELAHAYQHGHIQDVGKLAYYDRAELFTRFVDHFYLLRSAAAAEGNDVYALFYKLIMNSLPGKFAQRQWKWAEDLSVPPIQPWGNWYHHDLEKMTTQLYRSVAWYTQKNYRTGEANDSFPLIAAYVTSYARLRMKELRAMLDRTEVYYQDTDSLHVSASGLSKLASDPQTIGNGIGQLYKKGTHNQAVYYGLKHYALDGVLTYGGLSKKASPSETRQNSHIKFTKLGAALQAGIPDSVTVSEHNLTPSLCHPDGTPGADGWVQPITLPCDDPFTAFGVDAGKGWLSGAS